MSVCHIIRLEGDIHDEYKNERTNAVLYVRRTPLRHIVSHMFPVEIGITFRALFFLLNEI